MPTIRNADLKFTKSLSRRSKTTRIVLHHAEATKCSAADIHRWHRERGWAGAGYHYLVRKDGSIWSLRPAWSIGAHAAGANHDSVGVCFEGNFMKEDMGDGQKAAGAWLVAALKKEYGISKVLRHRDVGDTDCPGAKFPFDEIANGSAKPASKPAAKPAAAKPAPAGKGEKVYAFSQVGPGTKGNTVKMVQAALNVRNAAGLDVDGSAGPKTVRAIKAFQRKKGLEEDGWAGPKTYSKLLGE